MAKQMQDRELLLLKKLSLPLNPEEPAESIPGIGGWISPGTPPVEEGTDPTGETPATNETTGEVTEEVTEEVTTELDDTKPADCDHGWYPEATIALGILSLVLVICTVLLAIRSRSMKKVIDTYRGRGSRKNGRTHRPRKGAAPLVEEPEQTAPAVLPLSNTVQVGKLHCLGDRENQQDCLAVSPEELYPGKGLLAVVADGMGGLADGDRMSQAAASAMMNGFMSAREVSGELLMALTLTANQAVNQLLGGNQGRSGTTLVSGIIKDGLFTYVSVGDSRICLYRQGMLTQLNREHVYRNELMVQAINGIGTLWDSATHPKAAGLTSYLGMGNLKYVDIPAEPVRLRGGDKIILMSDGVYNAVTLQELETALALPAQQAADALGQVIAAKAYRNQDNYTAVILEV